jgi:hypothetical protein
LSAQLHGAAHPGGVERVLLSGEADHEDRPRREGQDRGVYIARESG